MFRWFVKNLRTLLLAFILGLAVWISAVTSADPDETHTYPNPVPIEYLGQDPTLAINGVIPQELHLTLRGPRSTMEQLNTGQGTIRAIVDLSGLGFGSHTVNIQIQINLRPIRVINASPSKVNLTLEPLISRDLPIELSTDGELAIGYQAGEPEMETSESKVSGPESLLNNVAHVYAILTLSDIKQNIEATVPLVAEDEDGNKITGVTIYPESIKVSLPVSPLTGYRDLAVKVATRGRPANGYRLTSVTVFPPVVTVYSENMIVVSSYPGYVETMPLDLTGISADIEARLVLNLSAGVILIGDQTVQVQVGIVAIQSSLTIAYRPIEVIGLKTGLQLQVLPATVDVILSGPLPILDTLIPSDVRVILDVTGLSVGSYQLTPTVNVSIDGVAVESILPGTVEVVISPTATSTP